ncbi:hypothetical protein E2C01_052871 [Portunus trituberculatus]|uniref:Uncharacterized protein n=1 Tax=Portunus trituberculatus TaxID=210409 RepID=A0A5B7GFP5_PORTR|nr:hypothetical protein [Portunus trituberculatus]
MNSGVQVGGRQGEQSSGVHIAEGRAGRRRSLALSRPGGASRSLEELSGCYTIGHCIAPRVTDNTMVDLMSVRGAGWALAAVLAVMVWPTLDGLPRNSLTLVSPSGNRTTWWTRGSTGPWQPQHVWQPAGRLPVKVRITTKLKSAKHRGPPLHPDTYSDTAAAVAGAGGAWHNSNPNSCAHCGTSIISGNRGHNWVGKLPHMGGRPSVTVWPFSVSSNGRVNVTTIEKGIPNTKSFLIYFGKLLLGESPRRPSTAPR